MAETDKAAVETACSLLSNVNHNDLDDESVIVLIHILIITQHIAGAVLSRLEEEGGLDKFNKEAMCIVKKLISCQAIAAIN